MSLEKYVPQIRFKGFSGEWDEVVLSSVVDVRSGKDYKHLGKGSVPVYGTGGYMLSVNGALSIDEDAIGIGRKGTIDKPYLLRAPFWTVDTLFHAVPYPTFELDFVLCLFQKIEWKKHDESTGVPSLSKVAINNIPVCVTNKQEQTAIGNTFQKLDSLINQHQQKHDKLSNFKKAMLEKMFPKPGKTTPEIRFKGFSGAWEEKYLSDVCWFQEGPGVRNYQFTTSGVKLFNGTNIEKGKIDLGKTNRYISEEEAYAEYSHFLADAGDVVIACSGITVAKFEEKVAVLGKEHLPLCMNTSTMRFKVKPLMMHRDYLIQLLASSLFKQQIGGSATGSAQLNFGPSHVSRVLVPLPQVKEQAAIGSYFQKLDTLINQHQQQITKLGNIKQACLRKMFV